MKEHRFLHLAGVGCAADQHQAVDQIAGDHGFGAAAIAFRIGRKRRQVDDRQLRLEMFNRIAIRTDQQVADEERVPGVFGDHGHRQTLSHDD